MTYDEILTQMILALEENDIGRFIELSYQIEILPLSTQQLPNSTQSTTTATTSTTTIVTNISHSIQATPTLTQEYQSTSVQDRVTIANENKSLTTEEDDTTSKITGENYKLISQ